MSVERKWKWTILSPMAWVSACCEGCSFQPCLNETPIMLLLAALFQLGSARDDDKRPDDIAVEEGAASVWDAACPDTSASSDSLCPTCETGRCHFSSCWRMVVFQPGPHPHIQIRSSSDFVVVDLFADYSSFSWRACFYPSGYWAVRSTYFLMTAFLL